MVVVVSRSRAAMFRLQLQRAAERVEAERASLRRLVEQAARAGLSQREIARVTGRNHATISRWLSVPKPKIDPNQLTIFDTLEDE